MQALLKHHRIHLCLALGVSLVLGACASTPTRAPVEERAPSTPGEAYDSGAFRAAATMWQEQALEAEPAEASALRLQAANAWLQAGDLSKAVDILEWVDEESLGEQDQSLLSLLQADVALQLGNPLQARQDLDLVGATLAPEYAARREALAEQVNESLSNLNAQSVQIAGEMVQRLDSYDLEAGLTLLRQLEQVPSRQLAYLATLEGDPRRAEWFDLALTFRNNLVDGSGVEPAVHEWKRRHPRSELGIAEALDLWLQYRQEFAPPARVAVLLPASGRLKGAGAAVRDGLVSAFARAPANSEIRFYDTGGSTETVLSAYFQAADDAADWIIGPLDKDAVEALLGLAGLATPVLALNDLPQQAPLAAGLEQEVFGMSLSPEQEAVAVARRMTQLGYDNVLLLSPENEWGYRVINAFEGEFLQRKRKAVVSARYLDSDNDHSEVLERVLHIDQSKARKEQLQNRLGVELQFEPVRRSDIDAIFMAADPRQGRLLTPQLRFFDAGNIPTFATARVFTGVPDPARNADLNGLVVPLTAWQTSHRTASSVPGLKSLREGQFGPLYAIGMDAWDILSWLRLMQSDPDFVFPGQTGTWSLNDQGELRREPTWSRFRGGVPVTAQSTTTALPGITQTDPPEPASAR